MAKPSVNLSSDHKVRLSPGGQNVLIKQILDDFCPLFAPESLAIYIRDTKDKWAHFDSKPWYRWVSTSGIRFAAVFSDDASDNTSDDIEA
jgi:hypothetical protein